MLKKILKEIVVIIVGKQAEPIAELLDSKKYVNEFSIAKKMGITINQTRNILYKISDYGLVSSIRKKDKKKGWYTYFWKIEILKSLEFLRNILLKRIGQINNQIKNRETKDFYICERCNIEFSEETALVYNFTCNECGGIFSLKDKTQVLKELRKNLDKLKKELNLVNGEIDKEKEKLRKERARHIKKEEKEKVIQRKIKKAMRQKLMKKKPREKLKKKKIKKKPKKKKKSKKKKIKKKSKKKKRR